MNSNMLRSRSLSKRHDSSRSTYNELPSHATSSVVVATDLKYRDNRHMMESLPSQQTPLLAATTDISTTNRYRATRPTTPQHSLEMERPYKGVINEEHNEAPIKTTSGLLLTHRKTAINMNRGNSLFAPLHAQNNNNNNNNYYNHNPLEEVQFYRFTAFPDDTANASCSSVSCLAEKRGHRVVLSYIRLAWAVVLVAAIVATGVISFIAIHKSRSLPLVHLSQSLQTFKAARNEDDAALVPIFFVKNISTSTKLPQQQVELPLQQATSATKHTNNQQTTTAAKHANNNNNKKKTHITKDKATVLTSLADHFIPHNNNHHRQSSSNANTQHHNNNHQNQQFSLGHLLDPFHEWMEYHQRDYKSDKEKQRRFRIWAQNHETIQKKNERHGPCKLTGQPIFGSNHFQDLTDEEFNQKYLTGYTANVIDVSDKTTVIRDTMHDQNNNMNKKNKNNIRLLRKSEKEENEPPVLELRNPIHGMKRHESIQTKYLQHLKEQDQQRRRTTASSTNTTTNDDNNAYETEVGAKAMKSWCSWDVCGTNPNCWINCALDYMAGNGGGTMIPSGSSANVESVDWRKIGIVTSVHSQGNCGACWAITATETIESCYAIHSGTLLDLDESEVIVCDTTCQMCNGGWPQNAYEYVMKLKGLRAEGSRSSSSYSGDFLISLTMSSYGQSDSLSTSDVESYKSATCASDSSAVRYGAIKSWGYSTDRCICYSNGSGCNCESQNEAKAIQNIATYGPAAICLDASTWKEYKGGIMTPDCGCSQKFLAMNHCVQVVGYIFTDSGSSRSSSNDNKNNNNKDEGKNDNSYSKREGYFIVRNQWGSNWGMNGYAYLSLGNNTCGILNDMTQAYME